MNDTATTQTDSQLQEAEAIERAQRGDADAFEFLYKRHSKRVYNLCWRMVKDPTEAEDLTQKAFLRVFQKLDTFRGDSSFSTWLHRVTVNVVLMHLRRAKPIEVPMDAPENAEIVDRLPNGYAPPSQKATSKVQRLSLLRAIKRLPRGYKQMFLLHDVVGYQHNEIAEMLGCTQGSSKSQLFKARKRLRTLLKGTAALAT